MAPWAVGPWASYRDRLIIMSSTFMTTVIYILPAALVLLNTQWSYSLCSKPSFVNFTVILSHNSLVASTAP